MPADDVEAHARLMRSTCVPVAVDEDPGALSQFKEHLPHAAASGCRWTPRIGEVTPWLQVAHLAEAHGLAVYSRFPTELHPPLTCAALDGGWIEPVARLDLPITEGIAIERGRARPSRAPGLVIAQDFEAITARSVARATFTEAAAWGGSAWRPPSAPRRSGGAGASTPTPGQACPRGPARAASAASSPRARPRARSSATSNVTAATSTPTRPPWAAAPATRGCRRRADPCQSPCRAKWVARGGGVLRPARPSWLRPFATSARIAGRAVRKKRGFAPPSR